MIKFLWLFFFVFVFANRNVHSLYDRELKTPYSHRFIRSAEHGDHGHHHGHGNFHKFNVNRCCDIEQTDQLKEYTDKMREYRQQCVVEIMGDDPKEKRPHSYFSCIAECVGKKINILDDNNNFIEEKFKNHIINEMPLAEYQKPIAERTVNTCIEEVKKHVSSDSKEHKCNRKPLHAYFCVAREFFKSCPEAQQKKTDKCNKLREAVDNEKLKKPPPNDEMKLDTISDL